MVATSPPPAPRTRIEVSAPTDPLFRTLESCAGRDSDLYKPLPHPLLAAFGVADHLG